MVPEDGGVGGVGGVGGAGGVGGGTGVRHRETMPCASCLPAGRLPVLRKPFVRQILFDRARQDWIYDGHSFMFIALYIFVTVTLACIYLTVALEASRYRDGGVAYLLVPFVLVPAGVAGLAILAAPNRWRRSTLVAGWVGAMVSQGIGRILIRVHCNSMRLADDPYPFSETSLDRSRDGSFWCDESRPMVYLVMELAFLTPAIIGPLTYFEVAGMVCVAVVTLVAMCCIGLDGEYDVVLLSNVVISVFPALASKLLLNLKEHVIILDAAATQRGKLYLSRYHQQQQPGADMLSALFRNSACRDAGAGGGAGPAAAGGFRGAIGQGRGEARTPPITGLTSGGSDRVLIPVGELSRSGGAGAGMDGGGADRSASAVSAASAAAVTSYVRGGPGPRRGSEMRVSDMFRGAASPLHMASFLSRSSHDLLSCLATMSMTTDFLSCCAPDDVARHWWMLEVQRAMTQLMMTTILSSQDYASIIRNQTGSRPSPEPMLLEDLLEECAELTQAHFFRQRLPVRYSLDRRIADRRILADPAWLKHMLMICLAHVRDTLVSGAIDVRVVLLMDNGDVAPSRRSATTKLARKAEAASAWQGRPVVRFEVRDTGVPPRGDSAGAATAATAATVGGGAASDGDGGGGGGMGRTETGDGGRGVGGSSAEGSGDSVAAGADMLTPGGLSNLTGTDTPGLGLFILRFKSALMNGQCGVIDGSSSSSRSSRSRRSKGGDVESSVWFEIPYVLDPAEFSGERTLSHGSVGSVDGEGSAVERLRREFGGGAGGDYPTTSLVVAVSDEGGSTGGDATVSTPPLSRTSSARRYWSTGTAGSVASQLESALVVDGDHTAIMVLCTLLQSIGFSHIDVALGSEQGEHQMKLRPYSAVFFNPLIMPKLDGPRCVQRFRTWERAHRSTRQFICGVTADARGKSICAGAGMDTCVLTVSSAAQVEGLIQSFKNKGGDSWGHQSFPGGASAVEAEAGGEQKAGPGGLLPQLQAQLVQQPQRQVAAAAGGEEVEKTACTPSNSTDSSTSRADHENDDLEVDMEAFRSQMFRKTGDIQNFIHLFVQSGAKTIARISSVSAKAIATSSGDAAEKQAWHDLQHEAHTLKGSARMMHARPLADTCYILERFATGLAAKSGAAVSVSDSDRERVAVMVRAILSRWEAAINALENPAAA